jgi:hypothetical protein
MFGSLAHYISLACQGWTELIVLSQKQGNHGPEYLNSNQVKEPNILAYSLSLPDKRTKHTLHYSQGMFSEAALSSNHTHYFYAILLFLIIEILLRPINGHIPQDNDCLLKVSSTMSICKKKGST